MKHASLWIDSFRGNPYPALQQDLEVDVAIVGAGISGVTAAVLLKRAGKRVALLEMNRVAGGETGHTTSHVTEILDARYQSVERSFGVEGMKLAAESSRAAIERISGFIREEQISCGWARVPAFLYSERERDREELEAEVEAMRRAGLQARMARSIPLPFAPACALRLDNQAQLHPRAYLLPLVALVPGNGSYVFERTQMTEVEDGEPCRVVTNGGIIRAKDVLVTANVPVSNRFFIHTKIAAYRTYALSARVSNPPPPGLYWDTDDPYHYTRTHEVGGSEYLIVGGEDHKTGQDKNTEDRWEALRKYTRERWDVQSFEHLWSGQVIEPVDGLPFIGLNTASTHVHVATGYSGTGITFGTVAGMILSDAVLGRYNPWAALYDATRVKPLAQAQRFLAENLDYPAHLVGDRLAGPEADALSDVKPGEGKLVEVDGRVLAVYRNRAGACSVLNPTCPHMACYVSWNEGEGTWDCPCHGSRFDPHGKVLNGPATQALAEEELPVGPTRVVVERKPVVGGLKPKAVK